MAPKTGFAVIGGTETRVDGLEKVTGRTRFADDLSFPNMLYGRFLRSPHAHARIRKIDVSRAAAMPGVHCVLTGRDFPIPFGPLPISEDEYVLAFDKVTYVGEPVVAIAAIDEATADAACRAVVVDYEELDAYMTLEEALEQRGEPIHTEHRFGNIHKAVSLEFGDVAQGFAEAEYFREDVFFYQGNTHMPIEEHSCTGVPEGIDRVTLYSSTQNPHYGHRLIAKALQLPGSRVRVVATPAGGGFGGKCDTFSHEFAACRMALRTGRPVKFTLNREEVFYTHRGRHPVLMWSKIGFRRNGRITGMHFRSFLDGGAYGSLGVATTYYTGALQPCSYRIPYYKFEGTRLTTNKPVCGPKRGHGAPQPRAMIEVQMDKAAVDLGIDPAQLRLVNAIEPYSKTINHFRVTSCGLKECIEKVVEVSGFNDKWGRLPHGKGIGFAISAYLSGAGTTQYPSNGPHSEVVVKVGRFGEVQCLTGSTDIGQGSMTVHASIVAEVLGLHASDVMVINGDTATTPIDLGSYSSRVTFMSGNAALEAARRMRDQIAAVVAATFGIPADCTEFREHKVFNAVNPGQSMAWEDACALAESKLGALSSTGNYTPPDLDGPYKGGAVGPSPAYSYTALAVQVDVDPETGMIDVEKVWCAHDIGFPINQTLVIGQVEGGIYMGLSEALFEEMDYRKSRLEAPSMLDYKTITVNEMPEIETHLICTHDPEGPFGAKEVGQGPLLPAIPALLNAVYDAVGVRIDEVPCTPDKVLFAMERKADGRGGRIGPTAFPEHATTARAVRAPRPAEWENGNEGRMN
ncbi:MAG: molybdopterin-dependent oxidoreductase [Gammaproteobacteria bacterium]|nr:molybdopterin-dependent oxidoreductase [Gammaproteobacteria bacterium]